MKVLSLVVTYYISDVSCMGLVSPTNLFNQELYTRKQSTCPIYHITPSKFFPLLPLMWQLIKCSPEVIPV